MFDLSSHLLVIATAAKSERVSVKEHSANPAKYFKVQSVITLLIRRIYNNKLKQLLDLAKYTAFFLS